MKGSCPAPNRRRVRPAGAWGPQVWSLLGVGGDDSFQVSKLTILDGWTDLELMSIC